MTVKHWSHHFHGHRFWLGVAIALLATIAVVLLAMLINRAPVVYPQNVPFTPYGVYM